VAEQWLKCRVLKGMFSDERVVVVNEQRDRMSFFVPSSKVRGGIDEDGEVQVRVFSAGNTTWAVIPTEDTETIPIDRAELNPV
jgi:hypothetical protein